MKKIFLILLLYLFNFSANAGLKEIGSSYVSQETRDKINAQLKNRPESEKVILYFYTDGEHNQVWDSGVANEITDKLHEEVFKKCNKQIKKYIKIEGEECSLYFLDNKVVWKFASENSIDTKNIKAKRIVLEKDKKPGRFFEDQPDVTDDYQIHFNYLLAQDSEDREWDLNGKMEKILLKINKVMAKATAEHKKGDGVARKYKFDYRADGKLDITFIRLDQRFHKLHKWANNDIIPFLNKKKRMNNPKKIYFNYADIDSVDADEAGVGYGTLFLRNKSLNTNERKLLLTLHGLMHTQGGGYDCVPGMSSGPWPLDLHYVDQDKRVQLNSGRKLGSTYAHNLENCPQLQDSVYLTPTSSEPYDPYEVNCLFKIGKYNHPEFINVIEQMKKKKGEYIDWQLRFGSSCRYRDWNRSSGPSGGFYIWGVEEEIISTLK